MKTSVIDHDFIADFRSGKLSEQRADEFASQPREVVVFTLLALMGPRETPAAHQPSSTIPPFQKPPPKPKQGQPGAKPGHAGKARPQPELIDHYIDQQAPCCPDCCGKLQRTGDVRTRITEDMPVDLQVETTEHTIHSDWCPKCKKRVEPKLPDVLPRCTLGNRLLGFSAWMHYGNGLTISQIRETLNYHLQIKVTDGGLVQMWHRLAEILMPWYEQIHCDCLASAVLHADETGWRVNGQTHWLWCFARDDATFYMIDRSRGHPALEKFFVEDFDGVLITDFWAAYDAFGSAGAHQRCWPHLLRDVKEVDKSNSSHAWRSFARRLRRAYTDAIKLKTRRAAMSTDDYELATVRLETRLLALGVSEWDDADTRRLAKRLEKYGDDLLTFLHYTDVPADNNAGERAIRPAVMIRKNSYANHSDRGALTQAVLMSVFRTLKQRGLNPLEALTTALRELAQTGHLPNLPTPVS